VTNVSSLRSARASSSLLQTLAAAGAVWVSGGESDAQLLEVKFNWTPHKRMGRAFPGQHRWDVKTNKLYL